MFVCLSQADYCRPFWLIKYNLKNCFETFQKREVILLNFIIDTTYLLIFYNLTKNSYISFYFKLNFSK